ncbi:hypothetical protein [Bradyrhizobium sp. STM 3557]|uniref:hypothetical protein n=1 Tax=Bradyrhizobium sp. STM 3557 TaxID=578920 RepID=UPI00388D6F96
MSDASLPRQDIAPSAEMIASEPDVIERPRRCIWRRVLRPLALVLTAQYTIVLLISLTVIGTVRTLVLPHILTSFEAISAALKRAPF